MENIKYIKRIDTTNKINKYIDGQTLEFILPKNKADLSSFKIFFDVEIDPVELYNNGSYLKRFMPRLSSSIIETLTITKDGAEFQTIKDYNVIFNILNDASKDIDDIDSDRPDTLNYSSIDEDNNSKTICDFVNNSSKPLKYRCFINSFLGFLGEATLLDCSNHQYAISITLAPKYITYRGLKNTDVNIVFCGGGGGSGATATPTFDTFVSKIDVLFGCSEYTYANVAITGGGGSGATATAVIGSGGVITNIDVLNSGTGYTSPPTITITGDCLGGSGAIIQLTLSATSSASVIGATIINGGGGYDDLTPPTLTIVGSQDGSAQQATAILGNLVIINGMIISVDIIDYGDGYNDGPVFPHVVISSNPAIAVASIDTSFSNIIINNGGSGYKTTPFVSVTGGDPETFAVAVATVDVNGSVNNINILDYGFGYEKPLTITTTYPTEYHYTLTNVFGIIDVLPDNTPVSNQITFKHFNTVKGSKNNTKNTSLSHTHKGTLNYIIGTFVVLGDNDTGLQLTKCNKNTSIFGEYFKGNYSDIFAYEETPIVSLTASSRVAKSLSTENNLDNSLYFKRAGSNIKTSQFFMNGQAITPMMDIPQIYNVAKEFFNNAMTRVKSIASFENEFFVFPMMINQYQEEYSSEIEWVCSSGNRKDFNAYPILILCSDKTIDV